MKVDFIKQMGKEEFEMWRVVENIGRGGNCEIIDLYVMKYF